ncbi:unnamed protein product [Nezara viridula]|uniref:Uncharacterized protein n=1 Tax=Nezara viridula TaxID=85310 RepID=A0A9P0H1M6_NEZVI|nr:unnamed protein product [Nezara viridula]
MEGTKNEKVYSGLGTEEPQTEPLQGGALGKVTCPDVSQGHQESKATGDLEELEVEMGDRDEVPKGQRPKRGRTEGEIDTTPVKGGEVFEWAGSQSEERGWTVERIIRTKKMRRHSFVSSPEELKGMAEESFVVKEYCEEMDQLINEIRSYTDRTLSTKDRRHVNYILPRLDRIMEARTKWEEEARRMRRCEWVESKIVNIEQEIKSMNPREWKQDMKDMINEIVEDRVKEIVKGVKKEMQDFGKKVRQDNEVLMRSLEECDQNRKEEEEKIKNLIRIEIRKGKEATDAKFNEMKMMFTDVKSAMDAVHGNMGVLKERVKEMPWSKIDEVRMGIEKLGETDISKDIRQIGKEMKEVKEKNGRGNQSA